MQEREQAEEHLRVIRTLMERATIYRAISAPSALLGGLLAVGLDIGLNAAEGSFETRLWLGVCAIMVAVNSWFLHREAARRGEPFFTTGMKVALRSVLPSFLLAGVMTCLFEEYTALLSVAWCLCYGLGLLATGHFAPRSMSWLGRAFWAAGVGALLLLPRQDQATADFLLHHLMGLTFGLFHLVYAFCVWPRRAEASSALDLPAADA